MAIKDRKESEERLETIPLSVGASLPMGPIVLTAEETASLLDSFAAAPKPLSPEVKRAIANHKRIKSERLR